ncbi:MAG: ParB/RepB/Spo0J family partition protein, partial [Chloroflexi bacterium]|nr:ParB/RepB/Spo0J family partition protein [Chloroflexota bacterium]
MTVSLVATLRLCTKSSSGSRYAFLTGDLRGALPNLLVETMPTELKQHRNPVAVAQEWQALLDTGEVASRAVLARRLGVSRAHVTQVLRLLQLAPEVINSVVALGDPLPSKVIGTHALRTFTVLRHEEQMARLNTLLK